MNHVSSALVLAVTTVLGGTASIAATPLELTSDIFVERHVVRKDGTHTVVLEKPNMVTPGDSLVFVVRYKNVGVSTANNFVVTNPLPAAVAFNGTSDGMEVVSIDGGKNWGALNSLRVAKIDGTNRTAALTDVTHIKWNLNQPLTAGAQGKLIFRGIVK